MGRDKALLPHRQGGCWLERTLALLGELELPITLLSRHQAPDQISAFFGVLAGAIGSLVVVFFRAQ